MKTKYEVVIACGGLGSRLKEITKNIPKPLYPIHGKSTIERCIEQISNYEISSVLITLGYKSNYFRDFINQLAKKYKINIDIFIEESPLGECGALWLIKDKLTKDFIFINGDLIFSIDFHRLTYFHKRLCSGLTLVTHTSDHPDDSDLVSAPNGTLVEEIFIKGKSRDGNAYLGNSGIFVINRSLLDKISAPKTNKSNSVFHHIVRNIFYMNINIYSYNTSEYIKDMGTPNRLKKVEEDLLLNKVNSGNYKIKQKALFLDRDNTLIDCKIGEYILRADQINFIDKNIDLISSFSKKFDLVCMVTNQPVIARGELTIKELENINSIIIKYCLLKGLKIDVVTFCPHHPHKGFEKEVTFLKRDCFCRKPNPGLFLEQAFLRNIDLNNSLMVGDSENDLKAAENAGCNFINVSCL